MWSLVKLSIFAWLEWKSVRRIHTWFRLETTSEELWKLFLYYWSRITYLCIKGNRRFSDQMRAHCCADRSELIIMTSLVSQSYEGKVSGAANNWSPFFPNFVQRKGLLRSPLILLILTTCWISRSLVMGHIGTLGWKVKKLSPNLVNH